MQTNETYELLIQQRGRAYRDDQIVTHSHYRDPIDHSPDRIAGNSHVWGDASAPVQSRVIDALIEASHQAGLDVRQTAYVLAIARVESGFNPDAAAGTTSAYGLGQFIDRTAARYGLNSDNRTDVHQQAKALVEHYIDNERLAKARGQGEDHIYRYHHDGPSKDYGGLEISRRDVVPYVDQYESFVRDYQLSRADPRERVGPGQSADLLINIDQPDLQHHLRPSLAQGPRETRELQECLNSLGYSDAHGRVLVVDGHYGKHTREAVTSFQRHQGLIADGIAGPNTWAALQEAARATSIAPAMAPPATVESPAVTFPQMARPSDLDAPAIRTLQQHLNTLHLADHRNQAVSITGIYDEATRNAVAEFQQTQGLPGTGLADPATRCLIEARATIAELQQNANMHASPMREASLLDVSAQTPSTPSIITQSQPPVTAEVASPAHIAQPPHELSHPASVSPAPSEAMTAPAIHHVAVPNQDAFATIQAQLREMQRQMEAMNHQREQEQAKEQDHARTSPYDPAPHAAHPSHAAPAVVGIGHDNAAMTQNALGLSGTDTIDPRQATHPLNGLYNELKTRIPDASEKRLLQFTAACHTHHITAENLGRIDLHEQGDYIRFCPSWPPGPVATVDLKTPAPEPQQCMAHIQQHDQQQVQLMAQIQAQVALSNAQGIQGPVLSGPSL